MHRRSPSPRPLEYRSQTDLLDFNTNEEEDRAIAMIHRQQKLHRSLAATTATATAAQQQTTEATTDTAANQQHPPQQMAAQAKVTQQQHQQQHQQQQQQTPALQAAVQQQVLDGTIDAGAATAVVGQPSAQQMIPQKIYPRADIGSAPIRQPIPEGKASRKLACQAPEG